MMTLNHPIPMVGISYQGARERKVQCTSMYILDHRTTLDYPEHLVDSIL